MTTLTKPIDYGSRSAVDLNKDRNFGRAFWVSTGAHGLAIICLLLFTIVLKKKVEEPPAIFEIVPVAGEGDNFLATEAPAGSEAGSATTGELRMPDLPAVSNWTPPAPEPPPAAQPEPAEPTPAAPEAIPVPNFAKDLRATIRQEKRKVEQELRRERAKAATAEKAAAAKAAQDARKKTASFEDFQKEHGRKTSAPDKPSTATASPGSRIDTSKIKRGVTGATGAGSTGAGGSALSRAEANAMDAYDAMLRARLLAAHVLPPGVSDLLSADVIFTVSANGAISGARIDRSSGSPEFDRSVLEAIERVRMPPRPDGKSDSQRFKFRLRES
ncbi:MAG: TonB C-terminal domain-containing protein [Verrucomicrobia bacterium]|nr:MAG: TonB C-terminal domain-containing protein [Verrucomicrobiota bacterium]